MRGRRRITALLLATSASAATAQQVSVRDLPAPAKEIEEPFSSIGNALELRSGQVLMVDIGELDLVLVDFAKGTRTVVGRKGSGPGEYRTPGALMRVPGDSIWVYDAAQQRFATWAGDLKPGTTIPMMSFDQATSTTFTEPMAGDQRGHLFATTLKIDIGGAMARGRDARQVEIPDSASVLHVNPRNPADRQELTRVRIPVSGKPQVTPVGERKFKYTVAYPGLVAADAWAVFPDGRVAIVRGSGYTVEFIGTDGKVTAPVKIPYTAIPVTSADRTAEMDEARRVMQEQARAAQKVMPANMQMEFELLPPASWPATYPAVAAMRALAAPDGRLWVKRGIPVREGREQWDVIDASGKLVARWRLPARTTIIGLGAGVVFAARTDDDDLRYAQRIEIGK